MFDELLIRMRGAIVHEVSCSKQANSGRIHKAMSQFYKEMERSKASELVQDGFHNVLIATADSNRNGLFVFVKRQRNGRHFCNLP